MRETEPFAHDDDSAIESALRPKNLQEFVGQPKVREQLSLLLRAAIKQDRVADHMLFSGPPGLGKTTLAMIVAAETGNSLRVTSGPTIQHAGDLAAILSSLSRGEILFIDEIHRVSRAAEEMLYLAMEDFRVDVMVGKGPGATSLPLDIEPFTLIGATTRAGMLPNPLRDRFGFTAVMEFYSHEELAQVISRAAGKLQLQLSTESLAVIANASRGTPRIANRLLRRVRDYSQVHEHPVISPEVATSALEVYEIDANGLDRMDRNYLEILSEAVDRPVGLNTLSMRLGEESDTIESVVEPYLMRLGLIERTQKGRQISARGLKIMGKGRDGVTLFD